MPDTSKSSSESTLRLRRSRLAPYKRCECGICRECIDNQKWDERFAKFEVKVYWDERGLFRSTLSGL